MIKSILLCSFSLLIFLQFGFLSKQENVVATPSYIGTKMCGMCHKTEAQGQQLSIWEKSKHAQAYKVLLTDEANKVAKEKGFTTKAVETEACLKCHVSGYNVDVTMRGEKFNIEDGVQCETCHGPGSEYKSKKVMEDKKLSVENGLMVYEKTEDLCKKCHNEESPTHKEFKFEEMWTKIKHDVPVKK